MRETGRKWGTGWENEVRSEGSGEPEGGPCGVRSSSGECSLPAGDRATPRFRKVTQKHGLGQGAQGKGCCSTSTSLMSTLVSQLLADSPYCPS